MADDPILVQLDARLDAVERRLGSHTEVWEGIRLDMRQREERWVRLYREETSRTREASERMWARLDDLAQESRAQREALLALIDRLPPAPPRDER